MTLCREFYVRCRVLIENLILFDMIENSRSNQCGNLAFFDYTNSTKRNQNTGTKIAINVPMFLSLAICIVLKGNNAGAE